MKKGTIKNINELFVKYGVSDADQKAYGRIATAAVLWSMAAGAYLGCAIYDAYRTCKDVRKELREEREETVRRRVEQQKKAAAEKVAALRNRVERN